MKSYIKNTSDFVEQLNSVPLTPNGVLVSFDVKLLFPSVPVPAAPDAIRDIVQKDNGFARKHSIERDTALELLRISLVTTSLRFQDQHYELVDGLAIGSPVSQSSQLSS